MKTTLPSLSYIDVSGSTSINNSKLKITTTGFISASSDSNTNTILLSSSKPAPALSTGDLYFQQLKIISSVQAPLDTSQFGGNTLFSGDSYTFYTTFAAVSPLALSSFTTSKEVFLSMYPYTAAEFLQLSTTVGSMFISTMSTISTLYITKPDFSTGGRGDHRDMCPKLESHKKAQKAQKGSSCRVCYPFANFVRFCG